MMVSQWPGAALFVCVLAVGALAYWLGFRHGSMHVSAALAAAESQPAEPSQPQPVEPPYIPTYRVNELMVLMELGVLTPEEFEQAKVKLLAG